MAAEAKNLINEAFGDYVFGSSMCSWLVKNEFDLEVKPHSSTPQKFGNKLICMIFCMINQCWN